MNPMTRMERTDVGSVRGVRSEAGAPQATTGASVGSRAADGGSLGTS